MFLTQKNLPKSTYMFSFASKRAIMNTNAIMDSMRQATPPEVNKQVDLCVEICNRIYEIMEERGMKQRDLAKALGKTETEVSRWLSGTHNMTIATIAKIATILGDNIITTTKPKFQYSYPIESDSSIVAEDDIHI